MTRSVAVVGAGAVGVTAAHDLAARDVEVTLYERDEIASGSTGRAAGVLYDAFADPVDAAVADRAIERFREFSGRGEFEFVETPYVWLAREGDERRADAIRDQVPRMREHDRDVELIDPADLADRYPAVDADDVAVAAVANDAGRADPASYAGLLARLAEDAGATVRTGVAVDVRHDPPRVLVDGDAREFDAVLVAAGAHTKRLLADANVPVPLKPFRVQALTTADAPELPMLYDATAGFYLRPHGSGLLAGDGTETVESDPDDWRRDADDAFVESTVERLDHRVDGSSSGGAGGGHVGDDDAGGGHVGDVTTSWAGLCTATPDQDPLVGKLRDGLYVAAGWQGHGFMRAPALGEAAADAVVGEEGIPEFDPTRFTGEEEFEIVEGMAIE